MLVAGSKEHRRSLVPGRPCSRSDPRSRGQDSIKAASLDQLNAIYASGMSLTPADCFARSAGRLGSVLQPIGELLEGLGHVRDRA